MLSELSSTRAGRAVMAALAVLVVAVVCSLVVLWPAGDTGVPPVGFGVTEQAKVERVESVRCPDGQPGMCQRVRMRLLSGPEEGELATLTLPGGGLAPEFDAGDRLRVVANVRAAPEEAPEAQAGLEPYAFSDFERRSPLYLLAALFAVLVVVLARLKGVRSLAGLAVSLVLVTQFMVPAILEGSPPLLVAITGALAVMLVTVVLAHGTGVTSVAAILGSSVSLAGTALLAVLFAGLAQITGHSSEAASLLQGSEAGGPGGLSLQGLVVAGMVVAALGVLDDVTVSQASTVAALQRANPAQTVRRLFTEGLSVGRDHLSATVNTLVLAYVGAALPVLLIFESQGTSFGDALNGEIVAAEVVAMLVGSIGLVLAVPVTTALAAWLVKLAPRSARSGASAGHAH